MSKCRPLSRERMDLGLESLLHHCVSKSYNLSAYFFTQKLGLRNYPNILWSS